MRLLTLRSRFPFSPFPVGWYCVGFSQELRPGDVRPSTALGRELVLFRTDSGHAAVLDAFCPHMGAHLGHGGRVVGETIRCPMHGFRFDGKGFCVATGYGTRPPPKCNGRHLPAVERCGAIFVWHGPAAPEWELPQHDLGGYSPLRTRTWTGLRSHPQETTENSVDLGHFSVVHGYQDVTVLEPVQTDGPHLTTSYRISRRPLIPGGRRAEARLDIHVWGLGFSFVDVHIYSLGIRARHYVLATPTDGETIALRIALSFRFTSALRVLPLALVDRVVGPAMIRGYAEDVSQDFDIWTHKRYVDLPALAEGDGPVGRYRRWVRQFYADASEHAPAAQTPATRTG